MMQIHSARLGLIDVDEKKAIYFSEGLPGFEDKHRFVLVQTDPNLPFSFLQSIEDGELSFVVVNPFLFFPEYEFDLPDEIVNELGIGSPDDVTVYALVTIPDKMENATVNLLAPLVINEKTYTAKQYVLHTGSYSVKHQLVSKKDRVQRQG